MTIGPMLGRPRSGDAPGESSWDRQEFIDGSHTRSRHDRKWKPIATRGLRRREAAQLAGDVVDWLAGPAPVAPIAPLHAAYVADYVDECDFDMEPACESYQELLAQLDDEQDIFDTLLAVADRLGLDERDLPGWGTHVDYRAARRENDTWSLYSGDSCDDEIADIVGCDQ